MGIEGKSIYVTRKKNITSAKICSNKIAHLMWLFHHCSDSELQAIVNNVEGYKLRSKK